MFTKLDEEVISILRCPLCKGEVGPEGERFVCADCRSEYPRVKVRHSDHDEYVYDFRIHRPAYCEPVVAQSWAEMQGWYEKFHAKYAALDDMNIYAAEVDAVREIYTEEFSIEGAVLDVGGHQGRLRRYLDEKVTLYVDVDPFLECFRGLESQPNLLSAFPQLKEPANFLSCQAEYLPFAANSFDWVHMRSVLDHFYDPYTALKEAYRVLKPGGSIMIGVSIEDEHEHEAHGDAGAGADGQEAQSAAASPSLASRVYGKVERDGILGLTKSVMRRMTGANNVSVPVEAPPAVDPVDADNHMFHWDHDNLIDLLRATNYTVTKEHWQKPPYTFVIYVTAKK